VFCKLIAYSFQVADSEVLVWCSQSK